MKIWTEDEIIALKELYPLGNNINELVKLFCCSIRSIRSKAKEFNLIVDTDYSQKEIEFIIENYENMSYKKISEILNRGESGIRTKALNMGLSKSKRWTNEELEIIKTIYPTVGSEYIKENYLPHRETYSIINMATKLGVFRENKDDKYYNKEDLLLWLRDLAEEIGRTPRTFELTKFSLPHQKTYERYFGGYMIACELAGLIPNSDTFGRSIISYSSRGDRCLSNSELIITEFFICNNIDYKKEQMYYDYMNKDDCGNKRVDWIIGNNTFVEYFGMDDKEYYFKRMEEKRNLCRDYNIFLIELFRKDLNNLHNIFQEYIS